MKFEHLLKIYWSKGLFYNGKLYKFDWTLNNMFKNLSGLSISTKFNFIKRFELSFYINNKKKNKISLLNINNEKKKIINMYISQLTNTNNDIKDLIKFNIIRLYLIKTFRGRAQALGKPSRGQRTWSNSWNAYKCNKLIKSFINSIKTKKIKKIKKINYKIIKKKIKKITIKIKPKKIIKKKNLWF